MTAIVKSESFPFALPGSRLPLHRGPAHECRDSAEGAGVAARGSVGRQCDWPNEFFARQNLTVALIRSYQTERWKLVRFHHPEMSDEFHDRAADPRESVNLIDSSDLVLSEAILELDARLRRSMAAINDPALAKSVGR